MQLDDYRPIVPGDNPASQTVRLCFLSFPAPLKNRNQEKDNQMQSGLPKQISEGRLGLGKV
jgi:hypothetical protein